MKSEENMRGCKLTRDLLLLMLAVRRSAVSIAVAIGDVIDRRNRL